MKLTEYEPSELLRSCISKSGKFAIGKRDQRYFEVIWEVLDLLFACKMQISTAAQKLGLSTANFSAVLRNDPAVWRRVNELRKDEGSEQPEVPLAIGLKVHMEGVAMPAPQHQKSTVDAANCAIITVSDTRTEETDTGGTVDQVAAEAMQVMSVLQLCDRIVRDEPRDIAELVRAKVNDAGVHAVLLSGGTGIANRDTTVEAVEHILEKRLDGFGELFRMLSYDQVGRQRCFRGRWLGVANKTAVFLMPGSPKAVELAMDKLIVPELGHIVSLLAGTSNAALSAMRSR